MLNQKQLAKMIEKQKRYIARVENYIFNQVDTLNVVGYQTKDKLNKAPQNVEYKPFKSGDHWGGEQTYAWFKCSYTVPKELSGKKLYLMPDCELYEGLLFVNEVPYTNYASKIKTDTGMGNHSFKVFVQNAEFGKTYSLVLEAYTGRNIEDRHSYFPKTNRNFHLVFNDFKVMVADELIKNFYYSYIILLELYDAQGENSSKKAEIESVLIELNRVVYFSNEESDEDLQREAMAEAINIIEKVLAKKNSQTTTKIGLVGHSHMDTAWLWEIDETKKKCARTFANQISLMEQFPNYRFMQSSAAHLKFIELNYPELFEKITEKVKEGKYEPNGGVFIECDCNITGGEFLVRHFLWGQRYTMSKFGYKSNSFFLPDTFGYSAAIPQILKGVDINYFLTTKMDWNDTNTFPYTTYYWQGIDGTKVLAHNNLINLRPTPDILNKISNDIKQKSVNNQRLLAYGFGDGGGGPEDRNVEMAMRLADLEGCPKTYDTTVGDFMIDLEQNLTQPNTYIGELYLELHRGTLTSQHTIKRNNRKAEIAIRNAEYFTSLKAIAEGKPACGSSIAPLVETLLINQFHDILPGTCVPEVHDTSIKETTDIIKKAEKIIVDNLYSNDNCVTLYNTISFKRVDVIEIKTRKYLDCNCKQQMIEKLNSEKVLHVSCVDLNGFESKTFSFTDENKKGNSAFIYKDKVLTTPFAKVSFDENGGISSFIDLRNDRELKGEGNSLNVFLFGEDLPLNYDNWDIDADCEMKLTACVKLTSFEVVADGCLEFRIRTEYDVSKNTTLRQDIVFYAENERVDFETIIDWNDKHRLLKAEFNTSLYSDYVTQEIQYGNVKRTTKRNNSFEQAQFEVCNHKYTDLSENNYGIAILNDCKYGISVTGNSLSLTLHKGGCRPDPRGDKGVHEMTYSFYPHLGSFKAATVVANAYALNYPVVAVGGKTQLPKLMSADMPNIVVETVKPCEDSEKAVIVRMYETEGSYTNINVNYSDKIKHVTQTNMLEVPLSTQDDFSKLKFKPYEIKTFRLTF